jgi:hypothetical protein
MGEHSHVGGKHLDHGQVLGSVFDQKRRNAGDGREPVPQRRVCKTFGEVIAQLNITSKGSGWSAYMNGGVQFGSDFTLYTGKGGARYEW